MVRNFLIGTLLLVACTSFACGDDGHKHEHTTAAKAHPQLEQLKKLAGTWVEADAEGKPTDKVGSIIRVTAGGSAVHETLFPGQPHEMISVYTVEGNDLVMTHYCVLGNQPRLKADPQSAAHEISFKFAGGANLNPAKDKHMHDATLKIVDAEHIEIEGTGWENGAPMKEMCGNVKLVRQE